MQRDQALHLPAERRRAIAAFGVTSLRLFGSVARDEVRPDSDVDLMVEFAPPVTFDKFMGLKLLLEDLLGARVDLVTQRALRLRLRTRIEQEAMDVA
jgi:uncharacterized protein